MALSSTNGAIAIAIAKSRAFGDDCRNPNPCTSPSFSSVFFAQRRWVLEAGQAKAKVSWAKGGVRAAASSVESKKAFYPGEKKGFVEEMRFVAMKLHTRDQAKEGEKEAQTPVTKWKSSVESYLKFLVDSKVVYDTLEGIVEEAIHPAYAEFRSTGLERSGKLAQDLEWFRSEGYQIPEPGEAGLSYAQTLKELAEKDPPAFICHFYNIYFAHSAGGRMIGSMVSKQVLNGKELEFYKWDKELSELLTPVKEKLNKVAEGWTREEKDHCLQETAKSFQNSGKLLRLIVS